MGSRRALGDHDRPRLRCISGCIPVLFGSGRPRGARAARSAACAAAYSALRVDELQLINQAPKYTSQILFFTLMFKILKYMIQKSETGTRWRTYLTFDLLALGRGSGAGGQMPRPR